MRGVVVDLLLWGGHCWSFVYDGVSTNMVHFTFSLLVFPPFVDENMFERAAGRKKDLSSFFLGIHQRRQLSLSKFSLQESPSGGEG